MKIGLFTNSSQTIGPRGLNFQGFMRIPSVITKFGDNWPKGLNFLGVDGSTLGWLGGSLVKIRVNLCHGAIFFSKFPDCGHNSMPE